MKKITANKRLLATLGGIRFDVAARIIISTGTYTDSTGLSVNYNLSLQ